MEQVVCHGCIEDTYLSKIVLAEGVKIQCSVCSDSDRKAITVQRLGQILEPIMCEHFHPGPTVRVFGYDKSGDWEDWEQKGDQLSDVVQEVLGQYFDFEDEIVQAVVDAEDCWPQDVDTPHWDTTCLYVATDHRTGRYFKEWCNTLAELKHGRRFFSPAARELFDKLFHGIDELQTRKGSLFLPVVRELPKGTNIFRARICNSRHQFNEFYGDPMKYVGPPPAESARAGRMNADGVAVLYAAQDIETCLAEMRPALGSEVAIIGMQTTHALRILDFSLLDEAHSVKGLSYFQPDLNDQIDRGTFLHRLHSLISQPIIPGREADYLITQTMAEYLAHVHEKAFDGISFSSVQRAGGMNIVLFAEKWFLSKNPGNSFRVKYMDDSIRLVEVTGIKYSHHELKIAIDDDGKIKINDIYDQGEDSYYY